MENFNEVKKALQTMGVANPTPAQIKQLSMIILEGYQVEIYRQELQKVRKMREHCAQVAKQTIMDQHPFGGGRDQMIQSITDAIRYESEYPNLTNTVKYLVAVEY